MSDEYARVAIITGALALVQAAAPRTVAAIAVAKAGGAPHVVRVVPRYQTTVACFNIQK